MAKFSMQSDPEVYRKGVQQLAPDKVRALALDLSLSPGVAMLDFVPGEPIIDEMLYLDMWNLEVGDFDSNIVRHLRLKHFLRVVDPDVVFFEDVKFSPPTMGPDSKPMIVRTIITRAATSLEFQGGLKATLGTWCEEQGIPCVGFGSSAIKKAGTGKGNASKIQMIEACNAKFGTTFETEDWEKTGVDNLADAAHLMALGLENYGKGLA